MLQKSYAKPELCRRVTDREVTGKVVGDKKLEVKGKVQRIGGEAQAKLGDVKQDVKDASKKGA